MNIDFVLIVAAFVLFTLSALGVQSPPRFNFQAAGLAAWVATNLF